MNYSSYFSETYAHARDRFLKHAHESSAVIESYRYPLNGPQREDLFVDVARVGRKDSPIAAVIISGTHGVEGFCGSAAQAAWLQNCNGVDQGDIVIYLVHALNPYGFAWNRRVNEDNVDLNRNCLDFDRVSLPENHEYTELEPLLNPRTLDKDSFMQLNPELRKWFTSDSMVRKFKAAVGKGQYDFPKGIIFGGNKPSWSHTFLNDFIRSLPVSIRFGCVIDIHTGLGKSGELEIFTEESSTKLVLLRKWFSGRLVTTLGDTESLGYQINGSVYQAFTPADAKTAWHCVALEFGTRPLVEVLLALQADNWLHCFAELDHPLRNTICQEMKRAFSDSSETWRNKVLGDTIKVIGEAFRGLRELRF